MEQNRRKIGTEYEEKAVALLEEQGYLILERNYHNRYGEIDIIARRESVLVFVEVKFRNHQDFGDPMEAVGRQKQRRICRVALYYCSRLGVGTEVSCRFDVVAIYGDQTIRHIENAFEYQE